MTVRLLCPTRWIQLAVMFRIPFPWLTFGRRSRTIPIQNGGSPRLLVLDVLALRAQGTRKSGRVSCR
jgi:hypothetical protein